MKTFLIILLLAGVAIGLYFLIKRLNKHRILESAISDALADDELTEDELEQIEKLRQSLGITKGELSHIQYRLSNQRIQAHISEMLEDGMLDEDEEKEIHDIALRFGIELQTGTKNMLAKYKTFWEIQTYGLPEIEAGVSLGRSEVAHFVTRSNWYEQRKITQRINYTNLSARVRIAKGVYYRLGTIKPYVISKEEMTLIDSGTLVLTSNRLLFFGQKGNKTIPLASVVNFIPHNNGIEIHKPAGRVPFLEIPEADLFAFMLNKAVQDN